MNKNPELTKKELTKLCISQEEYIKELEEKLKTSSDEKIKAAEPSYEELDRERCDLHHQLSSLIEENNALRWSLTASHKEMIDWKNRSDMYQEEYYKECKRADKLFGKLMEKNDDN